MLPLKCGRPVANKRTGFYCSSKKKLPILITWLLLALFCFYVLPVLLPSSKAIKQLMCREQVDIASLQGNFLLSERVQISNKLESIKAFAGRKGVNVTAPMHSNAVKKIKCEEEVPLIFVANYGDNAERAAAQQKSCSSAFLFGGGVDACPSFEPGFLDPDFKRRNAAILRQKRGGGFWLWKPYIILETLLEMRDGDFLFYLDSDLRMISSLDQHVCLMIEHKLDVITFFQPFTEWQWTKADALLLMGLADLPRMKTTTQQKAAFILFQRTHNTLKFVAEWLTYSQDERIVGDSVSKISSQAEAPEFIENRHDQTVFSLLSKKWNLTVWPDPRRPWAGQTMTVEAPDLSIIGAYNPIPLNLLNHPEEALLYDCSGGSNECL